MPASPGELWGLQEAREQEESVQSLRQVQDLRDVSDGLLLLSGLPSGRLEDWRPQGVLQETPSVVGLEKAVRSCERLEL